jgi:hypothetical protein
VPDEKERNDPRTAQPSPYTGSTSGSVADAGGAVAHLAGGEGDAYPTGPGAESGVLQGMMTNPEVEDAAMGADGTLGEQTMSAAEIPMPANADAAEVERQGIARKPMDETNGGESHG